MNKTDITLINFLLIGYIRHELGDWTELSWTGGHSCEQVQFSQV